MTDSNAGLNLLLILGPLDEEQLMHYYGESLERIAEKGSFTWEDAQRAVAAARAASLPQKDQTTRS